MCSGAVSEKWFHNLNSKIKIFTQQAEHKCQIEHNFFIFRTEEPIMKPGHLPMFSTVFLRSQSPCRQQIVFACASACADAIQTKPHRPRLLILKKSKKKSNISKTKTKKSKISQNKSSMFRKMKKRATFLTLLRGPDRMTVEANGYIFVNDV